MIAPFPGPPAVSGGRPRGHFARFFPPDSARLVACVKLTNPGKDTAAPLAPATLEIRSGPLEGKTFELTPEQLTIGRDPSNFIAILDSSVSRAHCSISRRNGEYFLTDMGSRNGTSVNGRLVTQETLLSDGDVIRIGNVEACFAAGDAGEPSGVSLSRTELAATASIVLRPSDSVYVAKAPKRLPPTDRTVSDLAALLSVSKAIQTAQSLEELEKIAIDAVIDACGAERAAILIAGEGVEEFSSVRGSEKRPSGRAVQVSHTIVRRVLEEGVAVLCNDLAEDRQLASAQSLIQSGTQSVLAAPLASGDEVFGVLYVATSDPRAAFTQAHLELLTGIGNIVALAVENARHRMRLEGENQRLRAEIDLNHDMVGEGPRMREIYDFIARVASNDSTVLIQGESGTGKELVARAIHRNSPRANKPFVAINCAALTETLLESELFGHEKGSFTGATAQKKGKFEVAEGGTVFLDEIGEMTLTLQAKLLRALQERECERVGGTRTIKLDIRVVAATNRDLTERIRQGAFRADLYYRLNVVTLRTPPLRERKEDIPALAAYFIEKHSARVKRSVEGLSPRARQALLRYEWPGNVRELENAIEHAVVLGSSSLIRPEDLPEAVLDCQQDGASEDGAGGVPGSLNDGVREAKRQIIRKAVEQAGGNITRAAQALDVHPNHLHRLIRSLKIDVKGRGAGA